MPSRTETTIRSTRSGRRRTKDGTLRGLAYIGSADSPADDAAQMVWLGDCQIVRIGRAASFSARRSGPTMQVGLADGRVSREHATITLGGDVRVLDAGSKNGTFVNGTRVVDQHLLRPGDVLEIGHGFWRFVVHTPGDPDLLDGDPSAGVGPTRTICPALVEQMRLLARVVRGTMSVIVLGETGTGKEALARQIHEQGGRRGEFHAVNCAAIPPALLESTLFGHRRGAFTGAVDDRKGVIEAAHGGTLLLDEIGDLPIEAQVKLLRVLQEGEVVRLGDLKPRKVDVRVVAATLRDLPALVRVGHFREDLYGRLAGFTLRLPPLRDRIEDLGILIAHLLRRSRGDDAHGVQIDVEAMRRLLRHPWPFNVRELERTLQSALLIAGGALTLRESHFDPALSEARRAMRGPGPTPAGRRTSDEELRQQIEALLVEHAGNVSAVARAMGKPRTQIHRWVQRLRIKARPAGS